MIKFVFSKRKSERNSETNEISVYERALNRVIGLISRIYKTISFINYASFLFNGKYLNIWERLLRLRPVYNKPQFMPETSMASEASIREQLWQAYFSLFRLSNSLFDFQTIYNSFIKKRVYSKDTKAAVSVTGAIDISSCVICQKEPITAHRSVFKSGKDLCKHVYCYFCIKQALMNNDQYSCSICLKPIEDIELFSRN